MTNLKKLSILLVEDDYYQRSETAAFLELFYSRVIVAANGREALELFDKQRPDLVISDIRMPFMDGVELATCLKERSPDTPVILCTAFFATSGLLNAIDMGVAAIVRKPLDTDELLAVIAKAAAQILQGREITYLSD